jgi:hypothetical protein
VLGSHLSVLPVSLDDLTAKLESLVQPYGIIIVPKGASP